MKKYKYIYDINSGHYIKHFLNEDDNQTVTTDTTQNDQQQNQTNKQDADSDNHSVKSVDSVEEIQVLTLQKQQEDKQYNDSMMQQTKLLEQAKQKASEKDYNGVYDPAQVDPDVINILKKINLLNKQHALKTFDIEEKRLTILTKLGSETNEKNMYKHIPMKYKKIITESNINTAKVYMKQLVGSNNTILKNMHDFKKAFKNTNLLYGKDNNGYFIVAVDGDDLNVLSDTLEEQGYLRDEILDTVMPQILDRTAMIQ